MAMTKPWRIYSKRPQASDPRLALLLETVPKPSINWKALKWASEDELWDIEVFGLDPDGQAFSKKLSFDVPVRVAIVAEQLSMWNEGTLRRFLG
jgi:hypothetical protein